MSSKQKKAGGRKSSGKRDREKEAEQDKTLHIRTTIVNALQKAQQTVTSHQTQKKLLLVTAKDDINVFSGILSKVVIQILPLNLAADATKRYIAFLGDYCKLCFAELKTDTIQCEILTGVLSYHNAVEKTVRLSVCLIFEALLRTLDPTVERDDFYDNVVAAMKLRMHDKCPLVREKAASAIASFQEAKKECDVSQHLVVATCEDTNPQVRRQAMLVSLQKNVYFPHFIRLTRDVVSSVRKSAWEVLSKFKFYNLVEYCKVHSVEFIGVMSQGLTDSSSLTRLAASSTLIDAWLVRDMGGDCVKMLSKVDLSALDVNVERVAKEILGAYRDRVKRDSKDTSFDDVPPGDVEVLKAGYFPLCLQGLTPANLMLWKVSCLHAVDTVEGGVDGDGKEEILLPPLDRFLNILRDVANVFVDPDNNATAQHAKVSNPNLADHNLRILLSMFGVYEKGGYLAHTDDATRGGLVKQLGFLLKVVPETEPGLYVDDVLLALKALTSRHQNEVHVVVSDALHMLFRVLSLPQQHSLGFDDIETFAAKDAERRRDLQSWIRKKERGVHDASAEVTVIEDSIESDTKFLQRMLHIVLAFLSNCHRGEKVPEFCFHMIQLGRHQCDTTVKSIATRCLALECLMNPVTVHTFMPLLIADATQIVRPNENSAVVEAALGAVFDIVLEYGLPFFESPVQGPPPPTETEDEMKAEEEEETAKEALKKREAARKEAEAAISAEDCAKVGGSRLIRQLAEFLTSDHLPRRQIAILGFCKLLSANRVPPTAISFIIAELFANLFSEPTGKKGSSQSDPIVHHMVQVLNSFFLAYSYSHPLRQYSVAEGGILALRLLLSRHVGIGVSLGAQRHLKRLLVFTDAVFLQQVRDVDPEFAVHVSHNLSNVTSGVDNINASTGLMDASSASALSKKTTGGRTNALSNARLWRELSRHSLHEYIAMELLVEIAVSGEDGCVQKLCAQELSNLKLYRRDAGCLNLLGAHVEECLRNVANPGLKSKVDVFGSAVDKLKQTATLGDPTTDFGLLGDDVAPANTLEARQTENKKLNFDLRLAQRGEELTAVGVVVDAGTQLFNDHDASGRSNNSLTQNTTTEAFGLSQQMMLASGSQQRGSSVKESSQRSSAVAPKKKSSGSKHPRESKEKIKEEDEKEHVDDEFGLAELVRTSYGKKRKSN